MRTVQISVALIEHYALRIIWATLPQSAKVALYLSHRAQISGRV